MSAVVSVETAVELLAICGRSPATEAVLRSSVSAEWVPIRASLRAQLRRRGVEASALEDATGEASVFLWEALLDGLPVALAIWRAAARVSEGRRAVRRADLERWGCESVGSRDCVSRLAVVVSGSPGVAQALPCACCGERRAAGDGSDGRCGRCQRRAALASLGAC